MNDKPRRRDFLGGMVGSALAMPLLSQVAEAGEDIDLKTPSTVPGKVRRIAVEEHWLSGDVMRAASGMEWMKETRVMSADGSKTGEIGEIRLAEMDAAGISMQIISIGFLQQIQDVSLAIELARKSNDDLARLIHDYPDRFAGFAGIPTQDAAAAAEELERAVTQLGFKGALVTGRANGKYLVGDEYRVLWEKVEELQVPIYLHPADPDPVTLNQYADSPILYGNTWAWGVETATHALRIICSGVFDEFPKANLILGHLGESIPFLLGRFDEGYSSVAPQFKILKKPISSYIKENLYVTTSGLYQPEALVCAISAMGADRILFAVDYPFIDSKRSIDLFESTQMTDADRAKIYQLNSEQLFQV